MDDRPSKGGYDRRAVGKATVTFACDCGESHVEALIERAVDGAEAGRLLFDRTGRQSLALAGGAYDVAYRAQGTPRTPFSLKVVAGGSMRGVDRVMPPDGQAAGVRRLLIVARLVFVPLLFLAPARAGAQAPSELRKRAEESLATVPNVSDVLQAGYYLAVEAGPDSTAGTGTLAVANNRGSLTASLSLSGPLDHASATKLPRKLDGLPNTGTVRIALHWFYWPARPDVAAMQRLCEHALHRDECDDDELSDAADRDAFVRLAHSSNAPLIGSAHAGVGRARFAYLDPGTLAAASEAHLNWEGGFGVGRYTPGLGYVAIEYEHQERFHAGETTDFCQTASTTALECRTVVVGRPRGRRLEIGGIEWRLFASGGRLAMNPSVSRDFRGRVWAVDLPFYFLTLSSSGLAGGARASWRSDTRDIAVALFVGTALRPTP